jgi:amidohydrolase
MTATRASLRDDIDEIMPGVIADRRHLHQHPELGFQEFETSKFVADRLRQLGVEDIRTGIATTGVTGLIRGTKPSSGPEKVVLLRADMDALPIHEQNEVEYKSVNQGVMHACGHDAHTSILLAVSRLLVDRRDEFSGTVKVLFQPAEEGGGGAKIMIDEGVMDDPKVDAVFGLHMDQDSPVGTIGWVAGPAGAASDRFDLTIQGRGGHGARPSRCIDPIVVGSEIIVALQTIVSREVNPILPAVITIGSFRAGEAPNVIPDTAEMRATVRSFDPEVRELLQQRIAETIEGIATTMRATVDLRYYLGYPPLVNEPEMTELVRQVAAEVVGPERTIEGKPQMGSEDFAYFLQLVPGSFFNVGTKNPDKGLIWGHHHPRFDIDEEGMSYGIETMIGVVKKYLDG